MSENKLYCVISHTHWDREWYLPFEGFRMKLVDLIDNLLKILKKYKDYRFHLDAQTILLEDYLKIKPGKREILQKYISEGRILVGPWYVQNDFCLTSGEATVRNLLIGIDIARQFGRCTMIGYAPDQFGLISQLPQIFNKFGIDSSIFARGYRLDESKKAEFFWKSKDGSKVLVIYMPYWYNNAQRFPSNIKESTKLLSAIIKRLDVTSSTDYYLLMNGVDLLEAQENLLPILREINKKLPGGEKIIQDTMPEYIKKVKSSIKNLTEYTGEMRNDINMLAGTLSSRVYLKQWNTKCQALLEKRVEPIYSFIEMLGVKEYPEEYFQYLWKLLIRNHPHDSICGCSVDRVHEQMMDRFKRVHETGIDLFNRGMEFLTSYIIREKLSQGHYLITVFNTSQNPRNGVVEIKIDFLREENIDEFCIINEQGKAVPFVILNKKNEWKEMITPINLHGFIKVVSYYIKLWIDNITGCSYRTFIVKPGKNIKSISTPLKSRLNTMENEFLKVVILPNGLINLYDKENNKIYRNLLLIEDKEDIGTFYRYADNPEIDLIRFSSCKARIKRIEKNIMNITYSVSYNLSLPEKYHFNWNRRSSKIVKVPVEILISLNRGNRNLDVQIKIDNKVKDHRLRVLFPTGIKTDISTAGSPYDAIPRNKKLTKREEGFSPDQPNTGYINVDDKKGYGIAFFNEGLYEYENLLDKNNTIAITLLRGNGSVNSQSMDFKNLNWTVPENQCTGIHNFKLAIRPHKGDFLQAEIDREAQNFLNPLFAYFHPVDIKKFKKGRPMPVLRNLSIPDTFYREKKYPRLELPFKKQFLKIRGKNIILSCIKKKEKENSIIIRVYNISSIKRKFSLWLCRKIKKAYIVNLKEERINPLDFNGQTISSISARPKEIISIEVV